MFRIFTLIIIFLIFNTGKYTYASNSSGQLGSIDFSTSVSGTAQKHFLHGVAALHSFWYTEALSSFKKSVSLDPEFAMGYWGLAMAHNHPLWEEQDYQSAKVALSKINNFSNFLLAFTFFLNDKNSFLNIAYFGPNNFTVFFCTNLSYLLSNLS